MLCVKLAPISTQFHWDWPQVCPQKRYQKHKILKPTCLSPRIMLLCVLKLSVCMCLCLHRRGRVHITSLFFSPLALHWWLLFMLKIMDVNKLFSFIYFVPVFAFPPWCKWVFKSRLKIETFGSYHTLGLPKHFSGSGLSLIIFYRASVLFRSSQSHFQGSLLQSPCAPAVPHAPS